MRVQSRLSHGSAIPAKSMFTSGGSLATQAANTSKLMTRSRSSWPYAFVSLLCGQKLHATLHPIRVVISSVAIVVLSSPGGGRLRNLQEEGLGAFEALERRRDRRPRLPHDVRHGVDVGEPLLKLVERPQEATDELGLAGELGSGPPAPGAMLAMLSRFRLELMDRPPLRVGRGQKLLLGAGVEPDNEAQVAEGDAPPPGNDVEPLAHVEDRHAATDHRRTHRQLRVHGETTKGGGLGSLRAPELQVTTVEVVNHQAPDTDRVIEVGLPRDLRDLCDEEVQFLVGELPILVAWDNVVLRHHSLLAPVPLAPPPHSPGPGPALRVRDLSADPLSGNALPIHHEELPNNAGLPTRNDRNSLEQYQ